jgi:hypothetical protein
LKAIKSKIEKNMSLSLVFFGSHSGLKLEFLKDKGLQVLTEHSIFIIAIESKCVKDCNSMLMQVPHAPLNWSQFILLARKV